MSSLFDVNVRTKCCDTRREREGKRKDIRWRTGKREDLSRECRFFASRDLFARAKSLETPAAYCTLGIPTAGVFCICVLSHSHLSIRRRVSVADPRWFARFAAAEILCDLSQYSRDSSFYMTENWLWKSCKILQKFNRAGEKRSMDLLEEQRQTKASPRRSFGWKSREIFRAPLRVKGGIILAGVSSVVYSRRADTREHIVGSPVGKKSRISSEFGIRASGSLGSLQDLTATDHRHKVYSYARFTARVRLNSSAKLSLFPPEAFFTE